MRVNSKVRENFLERSGKVREFQKVDVLATLCLTNKIAQLLCISLWNCSFSSIYSETYFSYEQSIVRFQECWMFWKWTWENYVFFQALMKFSHILKTSSNRFIPNCYKIKFHFSMSSKIFKHQSSILSQLSCTIDELIISWFNGF